MAMRTLEVAVQLVRDAIVGQQAGAHRGGEWLYARVSRAMLAMTSRGDRERLVANLAMVAASMAQRVPEAERDRVFDELVSIARMSPEDVEMLRELARFGMVS